MSIELRPETEMALAAYATRRGLTPDEIADEILRDRLGELNGKGVVADTVAADDELGEGTLYDRLKDYIGIVDGSGEALSQNCGERFTEYVTQKHQQGKL